MASSHRELERNIKGVATTVSGRVVFYEEMVPHEKGSPQNEPHIGCFLTHRILNFDEVRKGTIFDLSLNKYGSVVLARIIKAENSNFFMTLSLGSFFFLPDGEDHEQMVLHNAQ